MENHPQVWVVDDDEDDQYFICEVFRRLLPPVIVKSFYDGSTVLSSLGEAPLLPRLILLDLNMPLVNGFEVLRQIRAVLAYRDLPIIIFTTSADSVDQKRAIELGATSSLTKPPRYGELCALIKQLATEWKITYSPE